MLRASLGVSPWSGRLVRAAGACMAGHDDVASASVRAGETLRSRVVEIVAGAVGGESLSPSVNGVAAPREVGGDVMVTTVPASTGAGAE